MNARRSLFGSLLFLCFSSYGIAQDRPLGAPRDNHVIPQELLLAVALTESGTRIGADFRPWPWTLNVRGQAFRFASRQDAWQALETVLSAGISNVDIGAMQVNWHWHGSKFKSPWDALDPKQNVAVAQSILLDEWRRTGDLWKATGAYHSFRPKRAVSYIQKVAKQVRRLRTNAGQPDV